MDIKAKEISSKLKNTAKKLTSREFYGTRDGIIVANLSGSIALKGVNMLISLMMVPITLNFLEKTRYGLWAALSSVLAWFFIFDVGIGNGLRNKFIELKAKNDYVGIKHYVSTAYFLFGSLAAIIATVFIVVNSFVDWSGVLKAPASMSKELSDTVVVVFVVLCTNFILRLISTILSADMKQALSDGLATIAHIIAFVGMVILSKVTTASIMKYALMYTGSNLFVMMVATVILFNTRYKNISPSISMVRLSNVRGLLTVGLSFFTIQIALMAFTLFPNFVISNLLGPDQVADYSINLRYFSTVAMIFTMMSYPLWSGFGDAHFRGDIAWVKRTIHRLNQMWMFVVSVLIIMVFMQKPVFDLWLGGRIKVDYSVSILFVIYYILYMIVSIYSLYINAMSKLRLQMLISFPLAVLSIGSTVFLMKHTGLGFKSVIICNIMYFALPFAILMKIQSSKLLLGKATGIWNK